MSLQEFAMIQELKARVDALEKWKAELEAPAKIAEVQRKEPPLGLKKAS